MDSPEDKFLSAPAARFVLLKNESRLRRTKAPAAIDGTSEARDFRLIDCRPDLYECLGKSGTLSARQRCLRLMEDAVRFVSARLRRGPRRGNNDN
jgi:hypothetical protein